MNTEVSRAFLMNRYKTPHDLILDLLGHCGATKLEIGVFLRYHGMPGHKKGTFASAGEAYGLTREGARAAYERAKPKIHNHLTHTFFDDAIKAPFLKLVAEMKMGAKTCREMEANLLAMGLIGEGEGMHSVLKTLSVFQIKHDMKFVRWGEEIAVVGAAVPACWPVMWSHAKKMSRSSGAVSCSDLSALLLSDGINISSQSVREMISPFAKYAGNHHQDQDQDSAKSDFFYFDGKNNAVMARARTILSIVDEVEIFNLIGKNRNYGKHSIKVPASVVLQMLRSNGFDVNAGAIKIGSSRPCESVGSARLKIVSILRKLGGSATREDLLAECSMAGVGKNTAKSYIGSSGLFVSSGPRVYLVGTEPTSRVMMP